MKHIFSSLCILSCLLFVACKSEEPKASTQDTTANSKTVINWTVSSWNYSSANDNNYYYASRDVDIIDNDIFRNGNVQIYRVYDGDAQTPLPYVRPQEYSVIIEDQEQWFSYVETVDYEFGIGYVSVFYTASDFAYEEEGGENIIPPAMNFRIVITP